MANWRSFEGGPTPCTRQTLSITINKQGVFTFNAFALHQLGEPEAVELFFDEDERVIGVVRSSMANRKAFPVKTNGRDSHGMVQARPFLRHFGVEVDHTERFSEPEFDADGYLRLDLNRTQDARRRISNLDQWPKARSS